MEKAQLGAAGEDTACEHLRRCGYRIVARNWRTRLGEIDIVARDGDVLAFVEVKTRRDGAFGGPEAAVGPAKRKRMIAVAGMFLSTHRCELAARFDVVAIEGDSVRLVRDAFGVDDVWAAP